MKPLRDLERATVLVEHGCITERRSCLSKISYAERHMAIHAAKGVAKKTGRIVTTYACDFCKGWHLTKMKHGENNTGVDQ